MDQRLEQRPNVIPVDNETKHSTSRLTADGRTLTYTMTVLQQPVRARACGQGAKSSADRRPVDPPPIVELQIFEGDSLEPKDITFNMNANYFLFATLEQARPIAHGRMSNSERNPIPVLTGTPVAGMVYLDRPKPAGYFIFPDLSVRHEGKYRLSFSLYEETKQPKDGDKMEDAAESDPSVEPHVTHRLEVKSEPFHVFSAKKFPGLTESTSLSRMVAEQGCRVRIRRDVRMRRREPKNGSKEWDDYEDETAAQRARASVTPDPSVYGQMQTPHGYMDPISRPRSASNASHHSLGSITRRPSLQEMGPGYAQPHYSTAPHTPQGNYQQGPCVPAQPQQFPSAPYVQQPTMQPPPPQYQSQSYPAPPQPAAPATQPGYYSYPPAPAPPQQPQAPSHPFDSAPQVSRPPMDYSSSSSDYRRSSAQLSHPPPPPPPPPHSAALQQPVQTGYPSQVPPPPQSYHQPSSSASSQSYQSIDLYNRPPPMEPRPLSAARLPPLQTAMASNDKLEASSPISAAPQSSYYSGMQDTNKRSFGNVFSDRHQVGPLRQGARPSMYGATDQYSNFSNADSMSAADDEDNTSGELDPATLGMAYRRADGRQIMRALPGHA